MKLKEALKETESTHPSPEQIALKVAQELSPSTFIQLQQELSHGEQRKMINAIQSISYDQAYGNKHSPFHKSKLNK